MMAKAVSCGAALSLQQTVSSLSTLVNVGFPILGAVIQVLIALFW
jgi:hypothetical protein